MELFKSLEIPSQNEQLKCNIHISGIQQSTMLIGCRQQNYK